MYYLCAVYEDVSTDNRWQFRNKWMSYPCVVQFYTLVVEPARLLFTFWYLELQEITAHLINS
jgi:hypothetical protein